tara:strand:- start:3377 stop:3721 length:345 start_codon:yes stop_codon:yes gene_type:complete
MTNRTAYFATLSALAGFTITPRAAGIDAPRSVLDSVIARSPYLLSDAAHEAAAAAVLPALKGVCPTDRAERRRMVVGARRRIWHLIEEHYRLDTGLVLQRARKEAAWADRPFSR